MLHLYSATRGRVGAIAKGSRRPRSRFGGRLEPFFRLDLVLHEGRGELATVTSASTVAAHPGLRVERRRADGGGARPATRCCGCSTPRRPIRPPTTCSAATWRCSTARVGRRRRCGRRRRRALATALAFRLKLALAAGFSPELASCARCGEADGLVGFSGAAGGVVCAACERGGVRALRRGARVHGRRAGQPAGLSAPSAVERGPAPGRARGLARRSSTTPTCGFAPRPSRLARR